MPEMLDPAVIFRRANEMHNDLVDVLVKAGYKADPFVCVTLILIGVSNLLIAGLSKEAVQFIVDSVEIKPPTQES